jgi:hypothetical protein
MIIRSSVATLKGSYPRAPAPPQQKHPMHNNADATAHQGAGNETRRQEIGVALMDEPPSSRRLNRRAGRALSMMLGAEADRARASARRRRAAAFTRRRAILILTSGEASSRPAAFPRQATETGGWTSACSRPVGIIETHRWARRTARFRHLCPLEGSSRPR